MDDENQKQELPDKLVEQGTHMAGNAAKQGAKKTGKIIGKAIVNFVIANPAVIAIILAIIIVASFIGGVVIPAIDSYLDDLSAEEIDEVTYETLQEYCTIDETGVHVDKEAFLKNIIPKLSEIGIDLNALALGDDGNYTVSGNSSNNTTLEDPGTSENETGSNSSNATITDLDPNSQAAKYIYQFLSASLAGELPYIEGSDEEAQGIIRIKRKKEESEEPKDLTYIGYETFQDMLKTNDDVQKEEIMNYFSLDQEWNLCVAKSYKQTDNKYDHDTLTSSETEYTISEVKIPYRDMTSQYTVPFLFLINLQLVTHNANYVQAVSELMTKQSEIEFVIFDSITTNTSRYTYKADRNTRHRKRLDGTEESVEGKYETNVTDIKETTETILEIDNIKANVTKAKTWIIEQETNYEMQVEKEYPYEENGTTESLPDEDDPGGTATWDTNRSKHQYIEVIKKEWTKSGDTKTVIMPSEFMGLWSNETGTYVEGAPYKPVGKDRPGKIVEFKMLNGSKTDRPVMNIITSTDDLFDRLEQSVKTQVHAELMREMIRIYLAGEELTESTFANSAFTSMYEPDEFVDGSYSGDFDVHDESLFIDDLDTLIKAFQGGYSQHEKLVENAQAFLDMQKKYKVNALFAAAVSITETGAGRTGNAVNGCNNWFNITGTNGPYKTTTNKKGETYHWRIYGSSYEGIDAFGNYIANGSHYYTQQIYTVSGIGQIYCPNTALHPTQADDWIANTLAQISRFYEAVGIDISPYIDGGAGGGAGAGGVSGAAGEGYRGKYTVGNKVYIEYLQYAGLWKGNFYMGGTMKNSGCSVTSIAVILSGFGVDKNPEDVRRINPNGISVTGVLESSGLKTSVVNRPSATQVLNHLKTGNPVIINAGHGYWSKTSGHYFPVLAVDGNRVYVSNVGSSSKTGWYDINKVLEDNKKVIFISK